MNIFDKALNLHEFWKRRFIKKLNQGMVMDIADIGNCRACELGTWIYDEGLKFSHIPCFEAMCASHEAFHRAAAEIVQCRNSGHKTRALALLDSDGVFEQESLKLIALLMECNREITISDDELYPFVKVGDILKEKRDQYVYSLDARASIREALRMMREDDIGLIVVYKEGLFLGVFTERGFTQHIAAHGLVSLEDPVETAIDKKFINVNQETPLDHCMQLMSASQTRHAIVLGNRDVAGIISMSDIIDELKNNKNYPYVTDRHHFSAEETAGPDNRENEYKHQYRGSMHH